MYGLLSAATAIVSLLASIVALIFARQAVTESRANRNLSALMDLYRQSMSDEFRELRGRVIHTDEFDDLVVTPYGPKHQEIHRLLGLYEMLGAFARHELIDQNLVFALFPRSIITCYDKTRPYIEHYRVKGQHPRFGHNFEWLAEKMRRRADYAISTATYPTQSGPGSLTAPTGIPD